MSAMQISARLVLRACSMSKILIQTLAVSLLICGSAIAEDGIREKRIGFPKGNQDVAIKDYIRDSQIVEYILRAKTAQTITVTLDTRNSSNYFNSSAPSIRHILTRRQKC
jgi:hypothetical protein